MFFVQTPGGFIFQVLLCAENDEARDPARRWRSVIRHPPRRGSEELFGRPLSPPMNMPVGSLDQLSRASERGALSTRRASPKAAQALHASLMLPLNYASTSTDPSYRASRSAGPS